MEALSQQAVVPARHWRARLEVDFGVRAGRTVPVRRTHSGPLAVQRPFYPEGEVCHLYLLHPPGGLVGGDALEVALAVAPGAHALVTTPGATKFYRSNGWPASQTQNLRVSGGAALEWLPQETICFDGTQAHTQCRVELEDDARFIGWETLVPGRPAGGYMFREGCLRQRMEIWRGGAPLFVDALNIDGDSGVLHGAAGLSGRSCLATLLATPVTRELLEAVRAQVVAPTGTRLGITLIDDLLVCRFLGDEALVARAVFEQVWTLLRPALLGRPACTPRIWRT
ncbi:MAG TPA: urease accessory protein UreD [Thioalkalivibrio sp.]|nr:urease accessory protein UreD [Thioalkalivibrio sp.]